MSNITLTALFIMVLRLCETRDIIISSSTSSRSALTGNYLNLTCSNLKVTNITNVIWDIDGNEIALNAKVCSTAICENTFNPESTVKRNGSISTLSRLRDNRGNEIIQCKEGGNIVHTYNVSYFNRDDIRLLSPTCAFLPDITGRNVDLELTCKSDIHLEINHHLKLQGTGLKNLSETSSKFSHSVSEKFSYDKLISKDKLSCYLNVPELNINKSCTYPRFANSTCMIERNEAIVECDVETEDEIIWRIGIRNPNGTWMDISNRAWIRNGGRTNMIANLARKDIGKVFECRAYEYADETTIKAIGITAIGNFNNNELDVMDQDKFPNSNIKTDTYMVLALLFLAFWLITSTIFGIKLLCRSRPRKKECNVSVISPATMSTHENDGVNAISISVINRSKDGNENVNNSGHICCVDYEGAGNLAANTQMSSVQPTQGIINEGYYFTLEKSSPPGTSNSRCDLRGDANSVTQNQGSNWLEGYATVGESKENATCSYDLGEYAEVGEHLLGRGAPPQSIRPPVRKEPEREEVKDEDISKLYGKVNK